MKNAVLFLLCLTGVATAMPPTAPPGGPVPPATLPATTPASTIGFTGILAVGVMAIGGETTGTIISDGKTTYELDIRDAVLKRKSEELSGKSVTVKGTLTIKRGVEITQRHILVVESLQAADTAPPPPSPPPTAPR